MTKKEACTKLGIQDPWPGKIPPFPSDDHNWFLPGNQKKLSELITSSSCVLEFGAWLGASTRYLAQHSSLVVTVDHWKGSPEHLLPGKEHLQAKLPTLYETFLVNSWPLRNKILPLRMTTEDAHALLLGKLVFDLVYIDADHSYDGCITDCARAKDLIVENGIICGDDWNWGGNLPVRRAAQDFARSQKAKIENYGNFWWISKDHKAGQ